MSEEATTTKVKQPTALKRIIQSQKRRNQNKSLKAQVRTSLNIFNSALSKKEGKESAKSKMSDIFSIVDKGVKKGIFKKNKAARIKAKVSSDISKI